MMIRIFASPIQLVQRFAEEFAQWSRKTLQHQALVTVGLSGGSTPQRLYQHWTTDRQQGGSTGNLEWSKFHFFWGDERCVPPDNPESNYGVAHKLWLRDLAIPAEQVHRIRGEADPEREARRYQEELRAHVSLVDSIPQLDLVILGMGADGHTASIFPDRPDLLEVPELCALARHPQTGQQRITLTGPVIGHAKQVFFLITGADKAHTVRQVLEPTETDPKYPAHHFIGPATEVYLDEGAASELKIR